MKKEDKKKLIQDALGLDDNFVMVDDYDKKLDEEEKEK